MLTLGYVMLAFAGGMIFRSWIDKWNEAFLLSSLIEQGYMTEEAMEKFVTYRHKTS